MHLLRRGTFVVFDIRPAKISPGCCYQGNLRAFLKMRLLKPYSQLQSQLYYPRSFVPDSKSSTILVLETLYDCLVTLGELVSISWICIAYRRFSFSLSVPMFGVRSLLRFDPCHQNMSCILSFFFLFIYSVFYLFYILSISSFFHLILIWKEIIPLTMQI